MKKRQKGGERAGSRPLIRYADEHIVVVEKPAGLTTMRHPHEAAEFGARGQRFLPKTLADLLRERLQQNVHGERGARSAERKDRKALRAPRSALRAVHRLDKDTSGLVVFARTADAERNLGQQFRAHTVERRYLAVVRGRAKSQRIESYLVPDRGDARRGSAASLGTGKRAVTHVRVLEDLGHYTWVECRLETGRTHQVRIHLGEAGMPICGERVYDRPVHGRPQPDRSRAPRLALHAASLGFKHPANGQWLEWTSPLPDDLKRLLAQLRARQPGR